MISNKVASIWYYQVVNIVIKLSGSLLLILAMSVLFTVFNGRLSSNDLIIGLSLSTIIGYLGVEMLLSNGWRDFVKKIDSSYWFNK